jgi:mannan endo-1,4-beta-mannosidase
MMRAKTFDAIARELGTDSTRRGIFRLLGGAAAIASGVALTMGEDADAKKKHQGKGKGKKKGCPPCKKRKKGKCKKKKPDGTVCPGGACQSGNCVTSGRHFTVSGRLILDPAGNPVVFRGVNQMSVFFEDTDPRGTVSFPEIRKTGANSVRIVWAITKDLTANGPATDPAVLDALITNARANQLVPMVELHDATGKWSRLEELVAYWTRRPIVDIIAKHQEYLLVNIGNEVGDDTVTDGQFINGYTDAVKRMRSAGIHTPLVVDAPDSGKNLDALNATAASLLSADPEQNLIFSVHLYWGQADGADAQFIRSGLQTAVATNYPLIVGEFSRAGAYDPAVGDTSCQAGGYVDYQTIIEECHKLGIGWYAWEWGPGNAVGGAGCEIMDMTTDNTIANLKPGWATEVVLTSPYSIKNTSASIL